MNRRTFIHVAGTAATSALAASAFGCKPRSLQTKTTASTIPPSQIIMQHPGVQLYTLRELMAEDAEQTLAAVADMGYTTVETAGLYDIPPEDFRQMLERHGLRCPSGHYPFEAHEDEQEYVVGTARALGQEFVVWPWLPPHYRESPDDYRRLADRFNNIGRRFSEKGLRFAYHNHNFEFDTFGGDTPGYDLLLQHTDPEFVTFELDVYWVYKAGYDPLSYIERYPGRFALMHLKDGTAPPDREMVDVGKGVIDFAAILSHAEEAGLQHAFVEHDHPEEPLESVRTSYEYLQDIEQ